MKEICLASVGVSILYAMMSNIYGSDLYYYVALIVLIVAVIIDGWESWGDET